MSYHLPPELWHLILNWALDPQGVLSTSLLDPLDKTWSSRGYQSPMYTFHSDGFTKRSLRLVCKAWCTMATGMSRKHVRISYQKGTGHLAWIRDTLSEHTPVRIDIKQFPLTFDDDVSDFTDDLLTLDSTVHRNVELLSVAVDLSIPLEITFAFQIIKQRGPQLRYFQWGLVSTLDGVGVRIHHRLRPVVEHIPQFKPLEVLHISLTEYDIIHPLHAPAVLLPRLHTISVEGCDDKLSNTYLIWMSQWDLPALRNVSLDLPYDAPLEQGWSFIQIHGPKIHLLKVGRPRFIERKGERPVVFDHCQNLRHFICYGDFFLPTSYYEGVQFQPQPNLFKISAIGMQADSVLREILWMQNPKLAAVQLVPLIIGLVCTEKRPTRAVCREFKEASIRLENGEGVEIE
jgi:hypothetical protein